MTFFSIYCLGIVLMFVFLFFDLKLYKDKQELFDLVKEHDDEKILSLMNFDTALTLIIFGIFVQSLFWPLILIFKITIWLAELYKKIEDHEF